MMKYKIRIPAVEHTCSQEEINPPTDQRDSVSKDSIEGLLQVLEKHNIPFELIGSTEGLSTKKLNAKAAPVQSNDEK